MRAELPRCVTCRVHIQVGQNVVFRSDGRVSHVDCPPVLCVVCARSIRPDEPIRRDGEALVHSNCWVRRYRTEQRANSVPDLAAIIRERIAAGTLPPPSEGNGKVCAGSGSGRPCDGCEKPIPATAVECEIEQDGRPLRFHRGCLAAWHEQRGRAGISGGSAQSPWTMIFDLALARRAGTTPALFRELLVLTAEIRAMSMDLRARSAAARARSSALRGKVRLTSVTG